MGESERGERDGVEKIEEGGEREEGVEEEERRKRKRIWSSNALTICGDNKNLS